MLSSFAATLHVYMPKVFSEDGLYSTAPIVLLVSSLAPCTFFLGAAAYHLNLTPPPLPRLFHFGLLDFAIFTFLIVHTFFSYRPWKLLFGILPDSMVLDISLIIVMLCIRSATLCSHAQGIIDYRQNSDAFYEMGGLGCDEGNVWEGQCRCCYSAEVVAEAGSMYVHR